MTLAESKLADVTAARWYRPILKCVLVAFPLCGFATPSFAAVYAWVEWTYPTDTTAHAAVGALGFIDVSVTGPSVSTNPLLFEFDAPPPLPTQPTLEEALEVGHGDSFGVWKFDVDFSTGFDTSGFVLGMGNFGHGTEHYPGYQLKAFDGFDSPMSLSGFVQIGGLSYDHTWPSNGQSFNDDVSLNLATGIFDVTTVPGLDSHNSDILLLSLPADVGRLEITSLPTGPGILSGGDSINIVAIPEPSTLALAALSLAAGLLGRRRAACSAFRSGRVRTTQPPRFRCRFL